MKNLVFFSFIILGMMLMSFTFTENRKQFVKETGDGVVLINADLFSLDDLLELEDMTVNGAAKTTVVNKTIKKDWVNETIYKTEDVKLHADDAMKIDAILAKY